MNNQDTLKTQEKQQWTWDWPEWNQCKYGRTSIRSFKKLKKLTRHSARMKLKEKLSKELNND